MSSKLFGSSVDAAGCALVGRTARGVISAKVMALTEEVVKTMLLTKLKIATALFLVLSLAVVGVGTKQLLGAHAQDSPAHKSGTPKEGQAIAGSEGQPDKGGAVPPKPKTEEWVEIRKPIRVEEETVETGKANTITFPATVVRVYADALSITVRERTRTHIDIGAKTPNVKLVPDSKNTLRVEAIYETVLQHLGVSPKAKIMSAGKVTKLADLKPDTDVKLQLTVDPDGRLLVIGIEAVDKGVPTEHRRRTGSPDDSGKGVPTERRQPAGSPDDSGLGTPTGHRQPADSPEDSGKTVPEKRPQPPGSEDSGKAETAKGLKFLLSAGKGLKLTLSADKTETRMQPDGKNAVPVNLKLTFTNDTDKPIKLNAYALPYRIQFECAGPRPENAKKHWFMDVALKPPTEDDYPVLQPGKSWSPTWTPAFPGDIQDGAGTTVAYYLRQPGIYKLRMTVYDKYAPHVEGAKAETKWLESNELEFKVREKE
jgi:hypothetical protein